MNAQVTTLSKAMNQEFTFATVLPECLKNGNMPLVGMALFLQVTDAMNHSGLVLDNGVLKQGKLFNSGNNKVYFLKSSKYQYHYYPKNWVVLYETSLTVPKSFAENAELEIYINENDDSDYLSNSEIVFSHSCGYYNNEDKIVHDHDLYDKDDIVILHNGDTCHIDNACWIDSEDEYYHEDDCVMDHRGNSILESESVYINGEYYHNTDDALSTCDDCNETFHYESLIYHERNEESYCSDCYHDHSDRLERKDYSSNVLNYKGYGHTELYINKKPVYVGLELECKVYDGYEDEVNDFTNNCKYAIGTEDGSLDSNLGIEYIFRPEGLEQQKENVSDLISEIEDYLEHTKSHYYDADYGLHVHVSSHFLGHATKLKIQNFVNDNFKYLCKIGGRESTTYQDYKDTNWKELSNRRYNFVNICNSATIEFRFPAAIINEDHINMNLELALALTMFCKFNLSILTLKNDSHRAWLDFYSFLMDNKKTYPLLANKVDQMMIESINQSLNTVQAA